MCHIEKVVTYATSHYSFFTTHHPPPPQHTTVHSHHLPPSTLHCQTPKIKQEARKGLRGAEMSTTATGHTGMHAASPWLPCHSHEQSHEAWKRTEKAGEGQEREQEDQNSKQEAWEVPVCIQQCSGTATSSPGNRWSHEVPTATHDTEWPARQESACKWPQWPHLEAIYSR